MNLERGNLVLRAVTEESYEFIRKLRNDPRNSEAFVNTEFIAEDSHAKYMSEHMSDYFVCYSDLTPLGYIGVVENDIRLAVEFEFRNNGVARFMVEEILKRFPKAAAKIKVENSASIALFESLGFEKRFFLYEKGSQPK